MAAMEEKQKEWWGGLLLHNPAGSLLVAHDKGITTTLWCTGTGHGHNSVVLYRRSTTRVNHDTVVYRYRSWSHNSVVYCTGALYTFSHAVSEPITRAGCGGSPKGRDDAWENGKRALKVEPVADVARYVIAA